VDQLELQLHHNELIACISVLQTSTLAPLLPQPQICCVVSDLFYGGKLETAASVPRLVQQVGSSHLRHASIEVAPSD